MIDALRLVLANWKLAAIAGIAVGLLALCGLQQIRINAATTALATEKLARAGEADERNRAALRESERVASLQLTHATNQQEIVDVYTRIVQGLESGRADDAARAERVRRQFAATAARDRQAARSDPAACERFADRSEVVAAAAAEGGQLLAEARRALAGRDAEVMLLLGIVQNDRQLLMPSTSTGRASLPGKRTGRPSLVR